MNAFILLCAGSSQRMSGFTHDKILTLVAGTPVFSFSLHAFNELQIFKEAVIVYRDDEQMEHIQSLLQQLNFHPHFSLQFVKGGSTRQESTFNGLHTLSSSIQYVYVHDAARPLIQKETLLSLQHNVGLYNAAILANRITDTIKLQSEPGELSLLKTIDRSKLWAAQTPQAFSKNLLLEAFDYIRQNNLTVSDEASAVEYLEHPIHLVENILPNPKLTYPTDFHLVEHYLKLHTQ